MKVPRSWLRMAAMTALAGGLTMGHGACGPARRSGAATTRPASRPPVAARTATHASSTAASRPPRLPAAQPASQQGLRRVHAFVAGRVQGVGFRDFTAANARALGLTGWVRNLPDGRVEAVIEGPGDKVDRLLERIRTGPPLARVDRVETADENPSGEFADFDVRR